MAKCNLGPVEESLDVGSPIAVWLESVRKPGASWTSQTPGVHVFDRIIAIDWSGAAAEDKAVDLRIAEHDVATGVSALVDRPKGKRFVRSWTRAACRTWLRERLAQPEATLIALDFGMGYPWGTDQALFDVRGWRPLVEQLRTQYEQAGTARAAAEALNALARFQGHGPFRFNDSRTDYRFYVDRQVSYYRLADQLAPQAISQWYLGSGGTVGFHSISGLAAVGWLLELRDQGQVDFDVWPQEVWKPRPGRSVLVECYPALYPRLSDYGPCEDSHQRDAWRALQFLRGELEARTLAEWFQIPGVDCGRVAGVQFREQVQFEGWILGLRGPSD